MIIAGPRDYEDYISVLVAVRCAAFPISEVVSGVATGVDTLGERWAKDHGIPVRRFPADWNKYGKGAGPKRNLEMAKYADGAIILWDGMTKGTGSMLKIAKAHNLEWFLYGIRGYKPRNRRRFQNLSDLVQ